ncbi:MAG: T9SS type A sorting domain-containing protein [Bacteroidetes bacterium]|nr:T9SS type A sorting domain-containing protein [Bacteroidota bacterium]
MRSRFIFFCAIILLAGSVQLVSQTIPMSWIRQGNSQGASILSSTVVTDDGGNIYTTGQFLDRMYIGSDTLTAFSAFYPDIFLTKHDSSGNLIWAKSFGESGYDRSFDIAVDSDNNVYICGIFDSPSLTFGAFTLTQSPGTFSSGYWAKFSPGGQCLQAVQMRSVNSLPWYFENKINSITIDTQDNVLVTGSFSTDSICFGSHCLTLQKDSLLSGSNVFAAKFDPLGNCMWLSGSGPGTEPGLYDEGLDISADQNNTVFIGGKIGSLKHVLGATTLHVANGEEGFCAALDGSTGNFLWARAIRGYHFGEFTYDEVTGVMPDHSGNLYVGGTYQGFNVVYDSIYTVSSPQNPQNPDSLKVFLFKIDATNGMPVLGKGYGNTPLGVAVSAGWAISPDLSRIAACGIYSGNTGFDAITLPQTMTQFGPATCGYLMELDTLGNVQRALDMRGNIQQWFTGVTYDDFGKMVCTGQFSSATTTVGSQFSLQNPYQPQGGFYSLMLARSGTLQPNSVAEPVSDGLVRLWPNPASGILHIEIPQADGELIVTITNFSGQLVMQRTIAAGMLSFTVDSATLGSGCYVLSVRGKTQISHIPFVQTGQ